MKTLFLLLTVSLVLPTTACSPGLGETLTVNQIVIDQPKQSEVSDPGLKATVTIEDSREQPAIGDVDGREIGAATDVRIAVQQALESYLEEKGYSFSLTDGSKLRSEIVRWHVSVTPDFPVSSAQAVAALTITVIGPKQDVKYIGNYSGFTEVTHPFLSQPRVEEALQSAMRFAIEEAADDQNLLKIVREVNALQKTRQHS
jgi:uncharacterized lipoprotein YajG